MCVLTVFANVPQIIMNSYIKDTVLLDTVVQRLTKRPPLIAEMNAQAVRILAFSLITGIVVHATYLIPDVQTMPFMTIIRHIEF